MSPAAYMFFILDSKWGLTRTPVSLSITIGEYCTALGIIICAGIFFLSILYGSFACAQKYFFDNYGVKQGLSEQKVYTLLQDSKDNIWLGTASGASRFDGRSFENYTYRNGLSPGGVKCIVEDSLGYLWLGHMSGGGVSRYNGTGFEHVVFDSVTITGDINSIVISGGKIWFTSSADGAFQADYPVKVGETELGCILWR